MATERFEFLSVGFTYWKAQDYINWLSVALTGWKNNLQDYVDVDQVTCTVSQSSETQRPAPLIETDLVGQGHSCNPVLNGDTIVWCNIDGLSIFDNNMEKIGYHVCLFLSRIQ